MPASVIPNGTPRAFEKPNIAPKFPFLRDFPFQLANVVRQKLNLRALPKISPVQCDANIALQQGKRPQTLHSCAKKVRKTPFRTQDAHFFGRFETTEPGNRRWKNLGYVHWFLNRALFALVAVQVAAAIFNQLGRKDGALARMIPALTTQKYRPSHDGTPWLGRITSTPTLAWSPICNVSSQRPHLTSHGQCWPPSEL